MRSSKRAAVSAESDSHHRGGSGRPVPRILRTFLGPGSVTAWPGYPVTVHYAEMLPERSIDRQPRPPTFSSAP